MEGVRRTFVPRQGAEKYFHTAEHISCSTDICFGLHFPSRACQGCRAVVGWSQGTEAVPAWSLWWKLKCPSVNTRLSTAWITVLAPMRWQLAQTKAKKFQLSCTETGEIFIKPKSLIAVRVQQFLGQLLRYEVLTPVWGTSSSLLRKGRVKKTSHSPRAIWIWEA